MSDYIPFHIIAQIIKKLPIKSLGRFQSVSKIWKTYISSSEFITNYTPPQPEPQLLFVNYDSKNTFPNDKFSQIIPASITQLKKPTLIGNSKGLFCFYSENTRAVLLWNPTIRKSVVINLPDVLEQPDKTVIGFAVCPSTNDPKLVNVSYINSNPPHLHQCISQVEVFSLSSNVWRTVSISSPDKSVELYNDQQVIDGVIHWFSVETVSVNNGHRVNYLIMSFNVTTDEFTKTYLPDSLSRSAWISLRISKRRENLVVLEEISQGQISQGYHVWVMDNGFSKSFTKQFTIETPNGVDGFWYSGEPIMSVPNEYYAYNDEEESTLSVYQPRSTDIHNIGFDSNLYACSVEYYEKTVLLLDH